MYVCLYNLLILGIAFWRSQSLAPIDDSFLLAKNAPHLSTSYIHSSPVTGLIKAAGNFGILNVVYVVLTPQYKPKKIKIHKYSIGSVGIPMPVTAADKIVF